MDGSSLPLELMPEGCIILFRYGKECFTQRIGSSTDGWFSFFNQTVLNYDFKCGLKLFSKAPKQEYWGGFHILHFERPQLHRHSSRCIGFVTAKCLEGQASGLVVKVPLRTPTHSIGIPRVESWVCFWFQLLAVAHCGRQRVVMAPCRSLNFNSCFWVGPMLTGCYMYVGSESVNGR